MPVSNKPVPLYYTTFRPFQDLFQTGLPILTYHKLGRPPLKARLRGLYLSRSLFLKQLDELKQANFSPLTLTEWANKRSSVDRHVLFTFDDGFRSVFESALRPLADRRWPAIVFLVVDLIGKTNEWDRLAGERSEPLMDAAQVREWLAAGNEIGSHSQSHARLTQLPCDQAGEEISASKKKLEDLFGVAIQHFCYPYGDWNEAIRDLVIAAGYRTACTTEPGVNTSDTSLFALKRFTARYQTRSLRGLIARFRRQRG